MASESGQEKRETLAAIAAELRDEGDLQSEDGHTFCSERCLEEWCEEHPNEEEAE